MLPRNYAVSVQELEHRWTRLGVTRRRRIVWASNPKCKHRRLNRLDLARARRWAKRRKLEIRVVHLKPVKVPKNKRHEMKMWMDWALENNALIHYAQTRPMPLGSMKHKMLPFTTDCSGSTTGAFYYAGLPDPNGLDYNGNGFTGTLRAHSPRLAHVRDAKVGDFIVYGTGPGTHVVIVHQPGDNPMVFSHGQESGPSLYRHSVENNSHGGFFTVHSAGA